ncbi:antibiotic ABC transporter permease [Natrarchaeobius oligotrophus]|uniref:Antibiotic ABC transporter permease n=1 Tax=Natrarchaeobius chitinivorans TaxID=1679083 RepID=A0A3N6PMJ5_NATCH|nr:antibiotic ABC transporter permease [Natrarchaeobius chitinivorans]RQH00246.1 antibiotic ABC transporter permease [Natrarchaeobius chitinivorans]
MQSHDVPAADAATATSVPYGEIDRYHSVLDSTLEYARRREYAGPDYGDGMSSQLLQSLPFEHRLVNLVVQEVVKRAPVDVRPLFRVEHRRNYKGAALFSMANLNYHELACRRGERGNLAFDPVAEATGLADWLLEERLTAYSGFCGGHRHEIQHLHTKGEPSDPDIVSTAYAVRALLRAAEFDERYAEIARTASDFLIEDLNYREVPEGAKVDYHLNHPDDSYTLNAAALGAGMLVDLYEHAGDDDLVERATKILDHVAAHQTDVGGWPYRIPASASHLSMDSHHNGFIIEAFQRYRDVVDEDRYADTLETALEFYRDELFELDGAPNFDEANAYPRDIHASTQGILVFTREGDLEFADRILRWVLANLQVEEGRFYYRKYRHHTKRVTLMRWCQGWMSYAMSEFLLAVDDANSRVPSPVPTR